MTIFFPMLWRRTNLCRPDITDTAMVTFKIFGVLLILASGISTALLSTRHEKNKLTVLEAWIDLIDHIRGQIDHYLLPLDEILASADEALLFRAGGGIRRRTLSGILLAATPRLSEEGRRLIKTLLRDLGSSYRDEQVKRCEDCLSALRRERERMKAELPARIRLSVAFSLCGAIGTAILLW